MQEDDELLPPLEAAQPWRAQTEAQRARWEARQRRVAGQDTTTEDKVFQGLDHRLVDQGGQRWFDLTASSGEQQFVHQGAGILPPPTPRLHPQTAPVTAPQTFVPSGPQLVAAHTMTAAAASLLRMGSCDATQHSGTPPQAPRVAGFGAAPSVVAGPDLIGIYTATSAMSSGSNKYGRCNGKFNSNPRRRHGSIFNRSSHHRCSHHRCSRHRHSRRSGYRSSSRHRRRSSSRRSRGGDGGAGGDWSSVARRGYHRHRHRRECLRQFQCRRHFIHPQSDSCRPHEHRCPPTCTNVVQTCIRPSTTNTSPS